MTVAYARQTIFIDYAACIGFAKSGGLPVRGNFSESGVGSVLTTGWVDNDER
jgi:methyl coenzyme M reductase subunit C